MDFPDIADGAVPNNFAGSANEITRVSLVSKLSCYTCFFGNLCHLACLPDVVGKRLLAVDVLALPHGSDADEGMVMVRGGTKDRIYRFFFLQHDPKILIIGYLEIR